MKRVEPWQHGLLRDSLLVRVAAGENNKCGAKYRADKKCDDLKVGACFGDSFDTTLFVGIGMLLCFPFFSIIFIILIRLNSLGTLCRLLFL